jgi:hypothetical protein
MLSVHPSRYPAPKTPEEKGIIAKKTVSGWEIPGSCLMSDHPKSTGREQLDTSDAHVVAKLVREFYWCPAILKNGYRAAANFAAAMWIGIDFDRPGYSISRCVDDVTGAGLAHVIGTTVSHGKPKGDEPPCDRFRLLLRMPSIVTDADLYKRVVVATASTFETSDKSCTDVVRFFLNCEDIVSAANGFPFWPFDEDAHQGPAPPAQKPSHTPPPRPRHARVNTEANPSMPNRLVQKFLAEGAYVSGQRHTTIMHVIPGLFDLGLGDVDVFEEVRCRTPADKTDDEIRGAIRWWRGRWQKKDRRR